MSSRERILGRVRRALTDVVPDGRTSTEAVPRNYLRAHGERSTEQTVQLLAENLTDYRAIVHRCDAEQLPDLVMRLLAEHGTQEVLVPSGLPPAWLSAADPVRLADRATSTAHELDRVDSVVTGCTLAIAETGTLVLDGSPGQGRRRISLIPDHHICVVRVPDQVVASVPQALERLDPARPSTWISGPSATSDIELNRVEGVHGPRKLDVVLLG
ncbi:lactate utilization protein C [Streptomyces pluripotens]|uniref:Lactate utilization protein C n=1 Tax=Streptomyces pluripotens TaxID=1355015 RepID=A0A221NT19_9ACTN|nr:MULTISPECIES: lactate utilization protein C [Streptomyces]ARP68806.1 lactate utilization protein C [Streptomyces pluripotens]ASN23062.1 lactate utilization protein C [Streptomyces pluripotens]KIE27800.1 lactate utilization protein B/C [Streptomyces sp. MUSC 125]MCH0558456.1 lactate utilization protein C [Streptomyces sp. MUM 16J]